MITALAFVPKGKARPTPVQDKPSEAELREFAAKVQPADLEVSDGEDAVADPAGGSAASQEESDEEAEEEDAEAAAERARAVAASMQAAAAKDSANGSTAGLSRVEAAFAQLDMDNYDKESDDDNLMARVLQDGAGEHAGADKYITEAAAADDAAEAALTAADILVLACKAEEDAAALEVWVLAEGGAEGESEGVAGAQAQAYVHHDVMLPAFPLCIAWSDFNPAEPSAPGSFAAVGTFDPEVEIWDLDVLDALAPALVLGGRAGKAKHKSKKKGKKGKKSASTEDFKAGSHADSVLALAWNHQYRNVLASGSADHTIKAWDLATGACEHTLSVHTGKVQCVAWNPVEPTCLLSGGFDKQACVSDMRTPGAAVATWQCAADVEAMAWNPHQPTSFVVSSESGSVAYYDTRKGASSESLFTLDAHAKATTSMAFNPAADGLLVTGSTDKTVKLWSLADNTPQLLATQDLAVGAVFTLGVPADAPHLVVVGGALGDVAVWDLRLQANVAAALQAES